MGRPHKKRSGRYTVALVGDGFTEQIYFDDLKDTDRPDGLDIKPEYPRNPGSFKSVLGRAMKLRQDYSRVYALIDMDAIVAQRQQRAYQQLKATAERKGVIVLENNPCFEMWLLLHFRPTGQHFGNCDEVGAELRRYIPDYDKSQRFQQAAHLYANFRDRIPQAITNALLLEADRDDRDEYYPRAETFRFFEWYEQKRAQ
jgi:hypothetical protein